MNPIQPEQMISQKIRAHRTQAGLSQQQVAQALGIDRSAYTYLENGVTDVKVDRLIRLAHLFGIPVTELLPTSEVSVSLCAAQGTGTGMSADNADEKSLLAMFRQLDPDKKEVLLNIMREYCRSL